MGLVMDAVRLLLDICTECLLLLGRLQQSPHSVGVSSRLPSMPACSLVQVPGCTGRLTVCCVHVINPTCVTIFLVICRALEFFDRRAFRRASQAGARGTDMRTPHGRRK